MKRRPITEEDITSITGALRDARAAVHCALKAISGTNVPVAMMDELLKIDMKLTLVAEHHMGKLVEIGESTLLTRASDPDLRDPTEAVRIVIRPRGATPTRPFSP
jgi:hypothetical protein